MSRNLPLLVEDADWDALLGHIEAVVADLDTADRVRLVRQLAAAIERRRRADDDRRAVAELDALAVRVLATILPGEIDAAALILLQEWYALVGLVEAVPASARRRRPLGRHAPDRGA